VCIHPTTATDIRSTGVTLTDDGANKAIIAFTGANWIYTGGDGAGAWTNDDTSPVCYPVGILIDQLDDGLQAINLDKLGAM